MLYLGIDPGQTGGLAIIDTEGRAVRVYDTPLFEIKNGKKTRHVCDAHGMAELVRREVDTGMVEICVVEQVHSMPEQGIASAFNFGRDYGVWIGILAALAVPYSLVSPVTWKKLIMQDMGKDKDASRQKAMQLYPQCAGDLSRKKDHGRGDAILLAHYAMKMSGLHDPPPFTKVAVSAQMALDVAP